MLVCSRQVLYDIPLRKIISGGQTGVDRAALDASINAGYPVGGWCPKGRLAEDGTIPRKYSLDCTPTNSYTQRTEWNVRDSDGTLIISPYSTLSGGTAYTLAMIERWKKPYWLINMGSDYCDKHVCSWLINNRIHILNVAGPRESTFPGIYRRAYVILTRLLNQLYRTNTTANTTRESSQKS